ncbi:hypothetical protein HDG34_006707 [Paraburkholderia sp. HC6.4b]|nr:hypothetical protein [Paraburkholderia sp. HC6.4b]
MLDQQTEQREHPRIAQAGALRLVAPAKAGEAQQIARMRIAAARAKAFRIAVLLPRPIQQRDETMIELIEKGLDRFVPFLAHHDLVDHVRRHRGVDAVKTHERRAHGRRRGIDQGIRISSEFDCGDLARRNSCARC